MYTALCSLSQGIYNKGQAEYVGRTGAASWCGQSSSVNKEHQAFWLQREEKLLVFIQGHCEKMRFNEKKNKETQALLLDLLQIWWTGQQNSLGCPGWAHTASWFSLWTCYFISGCSECCDPWMSGAMTKQMPFQRWGRKKKSMDSLIKSIQKQSKRKPQKTNLHLPFRLHHEKNLI